MTAIAVAQPGRAAAYGAEELKRAAHNYGFAALAISVGIHCVVIALYYLIPSIDDGPVKNVHPRPPFTLNTAPFIPGTYTAPPGTGHAGIKQKVSRGIPVLVAEDPIVVEATIDYDPGSVEGPGLVGGDPQSEEYFPGEIPADPDVAPPDWVPVEKQPVIVRSVNPTYPDLALRAGIEGKVFVKIWVDKQGKIREVAILKSDYAIFNEAALEAARKFLFTPAYMNNGPVSVWVSLPFTFKLAGR